MLVVELGLDSPLLRDALAEAPAISLSHEEQYLMDDGIKYLFWAEGDEFAAFEAGLDADRTVTNVNSLAQSQSGRLYRVAVTDHGEQFATFPFWSDLDIIILDSTGTHDGWDVRMRMPDRNALPELQEVSTEQDVQFRLKSVYEGRESETHSCRLSSANRRRLHANSGTTTSHDGRR